MKTAVIVRGDTIRIRAKLEKLADDGVTWGVPNFTGATVRFLCRSVDSGSLLVARAGVFEDVPNGIAGFDPLAADFAGKGQENVEIEWEVTDQAGKIETYPKSPMKQPGLLVDDLD
jgi:hypothetical protein